MLHRRQGMLWSRAPCAGASPDDALSLTP